MAASKVEGKRQKTGGRQKGTPNKTTAELKDMVLKALENKGGVAYLERCAEDSPNAFLSLLGKVLPLQVKGELEHSGGITVNIKHF
jgi:hypothetical protein